MAMNQRPMHILEEMVRLSKAARDASHDAKESCFCYIDGGVFSHDVYINSYFLGVPQPDMAPKMLCNGLARIHPYLRVWFFHCIFLCSVYFVRSLLLTTVQGRPRPHDHYGAVLLRSAIR